MFSGGIGSWAAAKRVAEKHGTANLKLLFTDTKIEDEDLYRFLHEAAANVGGELIILQEGRDPWTVFFDERYLGNSRRDPCSKILKRQLADRWMRQHYTPETAVRYVGIDWMEEHRYTRTKARLAPWPVEAPMCEEPYLSRKQVRAWLAAEGIRLPRLYDMGFDHNNCGGFCVKAGQAHFRRLLEVMPARYAYHEAKEQEIRRYLGKPVSMLRKEVNGVRYPLTLKDLRESLAKGGTCDPHEWGGCSCFAGPEDEEPTTWRDTARSVLGKVAHILWRIRKRVAAWL
jgi:3'-phosphoadenosine 5'-phosphosulfate sulfotransferase (PAPS reductase)/FAD synthetase